MRQAIFVAVTIVCVGLAQSAKAVDYPYKSADDFKPLKDFPTIQAFEDSYGQYVQHCLDNTFGGTGGIPCLIGSILWDRELNTYYGLLISKLDAPGKTLLRRSQREWLKSRDTATSFVQHVIYAKYEGREGSMYVLRREGELDAALAPLVKERALWLKYWFERVARK